MSAEMNSKKNNVRFFNEEWNQVKKDLEHINKIDFFTIKDLCDQIKDDKELGKRIRKEINNYGN